MKVITFISSIDSLFIGIMASNLSQIGVNDTLIKK